MSSAVYNLRLFDTVLSHNRREKSRLLRDFEESEAEIDALVASGDCFITLATTLDSATDALDADAVKVSPELQKLTRTLIYLQRHYKVIRKSSDHRQ